MITKPGLIHPFQAVLPPPDKAHLVATRSYLTYSDYELKDKLARNPFSYLHVIHPSGVHAPHGDDMAPVRQAFERFIERGWLQEDPEPGYYVLRQTSALGEVTGILGTVPAKAAEQGAVKVHESTLTDREVLFAQYLAQVGLNAEPTLLAHDPNPALNDVIEGITSAPAQYDFTTADAVRHSLWRATGNTADRIAKAAAHIEALYIADGHHRVASSLRLAKAHPEVPSAQSFMTFMVPGDQLVFKGYHRVLNSAETHWDLASCVDLLRAMPEVTANSNTASPPSPSPLHNQIHLRGAIQLDLTVDLSETELTLPEWLQTRVFAPVFGIQTPRTDRRLRYLTEDQWGDLQQTNFATRLAFILPPMDFSSLKSVADAGRFMPPKSTWIAPKLRSGLTLFDFGPIA
jgi:uncharacterized protein (DUF1015 family)